MAEEADPTSKTEILRWIEAERGGLDAVLGKLTTQQMLADGLESGRSVKDLLAHITAWEQKMIQWINESYTGIEPQRPAPGLSWDDLNQVNQQIYLENKAKELSEVLAAYDSSYQQALLVVQGMPEEDLFDETRFAWRNGDPIWHMVAANTWWHYKEHHAQIEDWLSGSAG